MNIIIWRTSDDSGELIWAPVLMCHECGEAIDAASDGLCVWDGREADERGNAAELLVVHRTSCTFRDLGDTTVELSELLSTLRTNLGLPA
jgi:hypothetical protein